MFGQIPFSNHNSQFMRAGKPSVFSTWPSVVQSAEADMSATKEKVFPEEKETPKQGEEDVILFWPNGNCLLFLASAGNLVCLSELAGSRE